MKNTKNFPSYILCILSGITTSIGFAFPKYNFLIWFSLVPCFYVLLGLKNKSQGFLSMLLYGISFYLSLFTWLWGLHPLSWVGFSNNQSIILIFIAWLGLSSFESLFPALLGLLFFKLNKVIKWPWLLITLLWIIMEWIQGVGPLGLTWGRLANSQYNNTYIIQGASLFGSLFVSGLLVLSNALIACYLYQKNSYKYITAFLAVFLINFSYGYYKTNTTNHYDITSKIAIIQSNINSKEKWNQMNTSNILDTYIEITKIAYNNSDGTIDTVIWSETAIPTNLLNNTLFLDKCYDLSNSINATILVGSFDTIENDTFNTIFKISPFSKNVEAYHKQNLVPFGEYLPFRNFFETAIPILSNINAKNDDLSAGETNTVFHTEKGMIGNLICFDSIFPEIARLQVLEGANIIAIESNDSWFSNTAALHQHLSQAVFRAVENNRYVMRSANASLSALISPTGEIISALKPASEGYINYEVSLISDKTLYTELGDIIVVISLFIIIILCLFNALFVILFQPITKKLSFFWNMLIRK